MTEGARGAASGTLWVVGTGIAPALQITGEARSALSSASRVFYLLNDVVGRRWIQALRPDAVSLADSYAAGKERLQTYEEIVERVLQPVREGEQVAVAFYGHPGVFVRPGHELVRRAVAEGHRAVMLPGVSAEDCLFADLGVDPAQVGCQSFEANDFLLHERRFDPRSALVLWQVGVIGNRIFRPDNDYDLGALELLAEALLEHYPRGHQAVIYEAQELPVVEPRREKVRIEDLPRSRPTAKSTLYVPPLATGEPNEARRRRLEALAQP
ncbi:MAG: SAM-dependent methyltransferase [Acidobacteriota bacterium]